MKQFKDDLAFLSNMYPCNITATYRGKRYTFASAETLFQLMKSADGILREEYTAMDGYQAKRYGRSVRLKNDWNLIKFGIMKRTVQLKFAQNTHLAEKLLAVNPQLLVEHNDWGDKYWGVCQGKGLNNLGRILQGVQQWLLGNEDALNKLEENLMHNNLYIS